jgi:hypothetical protein
MTGWRAQRASRVASVPSVPSGGVSALMPPHSQGAERRTERHGGHIYHLGTTVDGPGNGVHGGRVDRAVTRALRAAVQPLAENRPIHRALRPITAMLRPGLLRPGLLRPSLSWLGAVRPVVVVQRVTGAASVAMAWPDGSGTRGGTKPRRRPSHLTSDGI